MAYIEKVKKGKKNFYYLTQTVRLGDKFKKVRQFLGKGNIPQKRLKELAKKVECSLAKEIMEVKEMKKTVLSKKTTKKLNLTIKKEDFTKIAADALVLPVFEEQKTNSFIEKLPVKLKKEVLELIKKKSIEGKLGEIRVLNTFGEIKAKNILLLGLGKGKELSLEILRRGAAIALKAAKGLNLKSMVSTLVWGAKGLKAEEAAQAIAEGSLLADYDFDVFKTKKEEKKVDSLIILTDKKAGVDKGTVLAEAAKYVRDLVNFPAAVVTPDYLGKEALKLRDKKTKVKVYGLKEIKKLGMNALLAVSSGSMQEPKFILIEYKGGGKKVALVGKGITFDAGGLNIKPTRYIEEMKQDMAGAGTVLGVIKAVQKLKLKVNVLGIIPTCENLLGGKAYKPGDILTAYNKKTIEVTNTDAEGRLILSDALSFAEKKNPTAIVDIATLTGAVVSALGYWATGLLSNDEELVRKLIKAGKESGERVWQLPMWDDYKDLVKSDIADVMNSHPGHDAGVIEGGMFLSNFIEKVPWAHLDIGGTAWFKENKFYFSKGGTGVGVRLLVRFLENFS
jgi:leucyl aminopeptidase